MGDTKAVITYFKVIFWRLLGGCDKIMKKSQSYIISYFHKFHIQYETPFFKVLSQYKTSTLYTEGYYCYSHSHQEAKKKKPTMTGPQWHAVHTDVQENRSISVWNERWNGQAGTDSHGTNQYVFWWWNVIKNLFLQQETCFIPDQYLYP